MSFGNLAPEILSAIGDFLGEPELKSLALTNHLFQDVFNRVLYRSARNNQTARNQRGPPRAGILRATEAGNVEAVRKFLTPSYGTDLEQRDPRSTMTPLHIAAQVGNIPIVELLLNAGANMKSLDNGVNYPLDTAIQSSNYEVIEVFLRHGLEKGAISGGLSTMPAMPKAVVRRLRKHLQQQLLDADDTSLAIYHPCLLCAALDSDADDVRALLQIRPEQRHRALREVFSFWGAVHSGSIATVKVFLEFGADVNTFANDVSCPPGMYTALRNRDAEMVRYLRDCGAHLNYPPSEDQPDQPPVLGAAESRDVNMLDLFVSLGGKVVGEDVSHRVDQIVMSALIPSTEGPHIFQNLVTTALVPEGPIPIAMLQRMSELGLDVINIRDADNCSPLHYATHEKSIEAMEFLAENGADVNATDDLQTMPLFLAILGGSTEVLEVLLQHGADPNIPSRSFHSLSSAETPEQAALLIKYGADVDNVTAQRTPLGVLATRGLPKVMAVLLEAGASVIPTDASGHPPLHNALYSDQKGQVLEMVKLLIQYGAPINRKAPPPCDGEALCHAVTPLNHEPADLEVVKYLLDQGANIHSYTPDGQNCVHDACVGPRFAPVLRLLLENGGDITTRTLDGRTALHMAVANHCHEIVSVLLEHNAPTDAQMKSGETALALAVRRGHKEIVAMLLEHGASPHVRKNTGMLPVHFAVSRHQKPILSLLLDHGADVNAAGRGGKTPLMIAVRYSTASVVNELLERGAQADATDLQGKSVLDHALCNNNPGVTRMIKDACGSCG